MNQKILFYIGAYVIIMVISSFMPAWRISDWWLFAHLNKSYLPDLAPDIIIVDIPYSSSTEKFRSEISALLNTFTEKPDLSPRSVVLDIWFSESDDRGLIELEKSLIRLRKAHIKTYAGVNPVKENDISGNTDPDYMTKHAQKLYKILDGKGHTWIDHYFGIAKYEPIIELNGSMGTEYLEALPLVVTSQYRAPSDKLPIGPILLHIGNETTVRERTISFIRDNTGKQRFVKYQPGNSYQQSLPIQPNFREKLVIIGSLEKDVTTLGFRGPELLAFAISERIMPSDEPSPKILANQPLLIVLTLFFGGFSTVFFNLLLRKQSVLRSHLWLASLISIITGIILLGIWVTSLMLLDHIYPQLSLVVLSIVVAALLTWLFIHRKRELQTIAPPDDQKEKEVHCQFQYDVFISYARTHENSAWVKTQVYEQLRRLRKADGSPLRVFFDQRNIEPGEDWYMKLALSIQGSRFFLPVYTADYFSRRFCEFEMQRAALRHVELGDFFIAIARDDVTVPTQYNHIQYLDVRTDADFMDRIVERIRKQDSRIGNGKENNQNASTSRTT